MSEREEVLDALDELVAAVRENMRRLDALIDRADQLRSARERGMPWTEIVAQEERPLIVEVLTKNLGTLADSGGRLRRLEAQALHAEGMSMDRIAQLFGVTRQRISELLRNAAAEEAAQDQ